jgi:hypothetical protein
LFVKCVCHGPMVGFDLAAVYDVVPAYARLPLLRPPSTAPHPARARPAHDARGGGDAPRRGRQCGAWRGRCGAASATSSHHSGRGPHLALT